MDKCAVLGCPGKAYPTGTMYWLCRDHRALVSLAEPVTISGNLFDAIPKPEISGNVFDALAEG